MKRIDFDFEIEKVELVEEDNIVVENKDMVVGILRIFIITIHPILSPRWVLILWGPKFP